MEKIKDAMEASGLKCSVTLQPSADFAVEVVVAARPGLEPQDGTAPARGWHAPVVLPEGRGGLFGRSWPLLEVTPAGGRGADAPEPATRPG
jgi:hypothetical protein